MLSAVALAQEAEESGNLPVGAVISLHGEIIGEGRSAIWAPTHRLDRHAEMEALRSVHPKHWKYAPKMKLFTTLEPCLMCLGAILLHRIGHVYFGSSDPFGGAGISCGHLPDFFSGRFDELEWIGPAMPEMCDPLYERLRELESTKKYFASRPKTLGY